MQIGPLRLHDDKDRRRIRAAAHTWLLHRRLVHALHARRASFLYAEFVSALTQRWNVEDEGPVSDLLNVHISVDDTHVTLKQEKHIAHLVATYLPDGVPLTFQSRVLLPRRACRPW
eukprot:5342741-Pleurochrysis_carterae.AAC.5